jgi:hypothetical protein
MIPRDRREAQGSQRVNIDARVRSAVPHWRGSLPLACFATMVSLSACGSQGSGSAATGNHGIARIPAAWLRADEQALTQLDGAGGACRPVPSRPGLQPQVLLEGAPPAGLTSVLRVLRQPAPAASRVSLARIHRLSVDAQGIYIRYARQGVQNGISYYMIPVASVGGDPLPARCFAGQLTGFKRQVAAMPKLEQRRAIAWERRNINAEKAPAPPGIVLVTTGRGATTDTENLTVAQLGGLWGRGSQGDNDITQTALVLPNSVATVTARYAAQTHPGRVAKAVTITRRVVDNLAILVFRGAWDPPKLTYHSATGAVLSTPSA